MVEGNINTWKNVALRSTFFGAGFALILTITIGGYIWYESRPKPLKPWDNNAIIAYYDYADTVGEQNTIVFYYTVENKTNDDYSINDIKDILLYANLDRQQSLSGGDIDEFLNIEYPIHIPSKHRFRFKINLNTPTDIINLKSGSTIEERKIFNKEMSAYISSKLKNLNGFSMFDLINRYKIEFHPGWKIKQ
jgi:hypothetical protein